MEKGGSELEMMLFTDEVSHHHSPIFYFPARAHWSYSGFWSVLLMSLTLIAVGSSQDVQMFCGPCQDAMSLPSV